MSAHPKLHIPSSPASNASHAVTNALGDLLHEHLPPVRNWKGWGLSPTKGILIGPGPCIPRMDRGAAKVTAPEARAHPLACADGETRYVVDFSGGAFVVEHYPRDAGQNPATTALGQVLEVRQFERIADAAAYIADRC